MADFNIEELMVMSMREGNNLYDIHGFDKNRSADEVWAAYPELGLDMLCESFVRPSAFSSMAEVLCASAQSSAGDFAAGVFIVEPYAFAVCCDTCSVIVFDSHAHGPDLGALLAKVPLDRFVEYFQHFFSCHYPMLRFDTVTGCNLAGHLTLFSL